MPLGKLTDTQLILLSTASQREDGLIAICDRLKGNAARITGERLLAMGWAREVAIQRHDPAWRTDDDQAIGLRITQAGLAAIGLGADGHDVVPSDGVSQDAISAPTSRVGSKLSSVITMLATPDGASIGELTATTGWLPHSARAALTGLRKKGFVITLRKRTDGTTAYYLADSDAGNAA